MTEAVRNNSLTDSIRKFVILGREYKTSQNKKTFDHQRALRKNVNLLALRKTHF